MTYNAAGDVKSATDVTHARTATMSSYDAHGRMLTGSTDMGVPIGFAYAPRGFVSSKTVNGQAITFTQNAIGLTTQVNTPDGQTLAYVYDATYRLTDVKLNGTAITPQMLASSEYPDTRLKATWAQVKRSLRDGLEGLIPSAWAQTVGRLKFPVPVVPGRSMPGQPEFDPRTDMMMVAPMSAADRAARRVAEEVARACECKPLGGYSVPTFTSVTYAMPICYLADIFLRCSHTRATSPTQKR